MAVRTWIDGADRVAGLSLEQPPALPFANHGLWPSAKRRGGVPRCWRSLRNLLLRLMKSRAAFDTLDAAERARVLERHQAELYAHVDVDGLLRLVHEGHGVLMATPHAIAFTVDHGPQWGVELRHLYVAADSRRRGVGRALVARLRAKHAGRNLFVRFDGLGRARFARLAGFSPAAEGGGWWQTQPAPLPLARGRADLGPVPPGCPLPDGQRGAPCPGD